MEPPIKPDESDCCNSGCNPCILDVYEEQLKKYNNSQTRDDPDCINCMKSAAYSYFKLTDVEKHTPTTFLYTFEYLRPHRVERSEAVPREKLKIIYNPGQHFLLRGYCRKDQIYFTRAYTPIPVKSNGGLQFTIVVRLYELGRMSKYLQNLSLDQPTLWRGPYGDFNVPRNINHMLCIAQGTGVAPIFSIVHKMVQDEDCYTFIKLFFCCRNCDDIILRDHLYNLTSYWNFSYEVFLSSLDNVKCKFNEVIHERKLGNNDIEEFIKSKCDYKMNILICGSDNFNEAIKNIVRGCDIANENIHVF